MPYDKENVLRSENAYLVLRKLSGSPKGSYATEIARDSQIKQSLASELLSNLKKANIVKKGVRNKAQYYKPDYEGLADLALRKLQDEEYDSSTDSMFEDLAFVNDVVDFDLERLDSGDKEDMRSFLRNYFMEYLKGTEYSTINKMITDDFYDGIISQNRAENPNWFKNLLVLAKHERDYSKDVERYVEIAFDRVVWYDQSDLSEKQGFNFADDILSDEEARSIYRSWQRLSKEQQEKIIDKMENETE